MAQWVEALATTSADLSSALGTCMKKGESRLSKAVF